MYLVASGESRLFAGVRATDAEGVEEIADNAFPTGTAHFHGTRRRVSPDAIKFVAFSDKNRLSNILMN